MALHTMRDEHFGIAVVELMSSGVITIAHDSAGPKRDIIGVAPKKAGYLANGADQYAFILKYVLLHFDSDDLVALRREARSYVRDKFSVATFKHNFIEHFRPLLHYRSRILI